MIFTLKDIKWRENWSYYDSTKHKECSRMAQRSYATLFFHSWVNKSILKILFEICQYRWFDEEWIEKKRGTLHKYNRNYELLKEFILYLEQNSIIMELLLLLLTFLHVLQLGSINFFFYWLLSLEKFWNKILLKVHNIMHVTITLIADTVYIEPYWTFEGFAP